MSTFDIDAVAETCLRINDIAHLARWECQPTLKFHFDNDGDMYHAMRMCQRHMEMSHRWMNDPASNRFGWFKEQKVEFMGVMLEFSCDERQYMRYDGPMNIPFDIPSGRIS